ncbi:hypothetical protein C8A03DRAFT_37679 [Achaetomium macrosporum]|uniref:Apple domain-containing protein n=1 Tax=Achaetomium macrosporum TaxID=79813 RepID=A0AAN7C3X3_9PEZI|nr:hypothetical protein C8A03DRAFT_37679 [Achaetomium macrosporum]
MRSGLVAVGVAAGFLHPAAAAATIADSFLEVCSVDAVLEYFACLRPVPAVCVDSLAEQATAWCKSYLSIEPVTVYLSTETPVLTETANEEIVHQHHGRSGTQLHRSDQEELSKACSCLNPQPTTVTLPVTTAATSTATSTATTVLTVVVSETRVSNVSLVDEVTEVITTTATHTAPAAISQPPQSTTSAPPDPCSITYLGGGNGQGGNEVHIVAATNARDCCEQCWARSNCIAAAYPGSSCQHLIKARTLTGADTSAQCPLGIEHYVGLGDEAPDGVLYRGPCMV